jgi:hypothetical protein
MGHLNQLVWDLIYFLNGMSQKDQDLKIVIREPDGRVIEVNDEA